MGNPAGRLRSGQIGPDLQESPPAGHRLMVLRLRQRSRPALTVVGGADDVCGLAEIGLAVLETAEIPEVLSLTDRIAAASAEDGLIRWGGREIRELCLRAIRGRRCRRRDEDRRQ